MSELRRPRAEWQIATVAELFEIKDHERVPVNANERARRCGSVPYYGATGQVGWIDDFLFDEELILLGEDAAPFLQSDKPKAYVIRGQTWVNNHAHVLRALARTPSGFWKYQFDQTDFHGFVSGTTRLKLSQQPMRQIPLLVPPFQEQHRIVEAIESYFTRLDDAVATLERVQRNLKRYRASVLKAAVEGRLVPTEAELARAEGREYEPASLLLERILTERRRRWEEAELAKMNAKGNVPKNDKWKSKYPQPEANDSSALRNLPPGWACAHLTQLLAMRDHALKAGPFGSALKKEYYVDTGYKIYGQEQVLRGDPYYGHYFIDESRYLQLASCAVRPRDVLISLVGTIGRTLVIPDDALPGIINPRLIKISVNEEVVLPEYLQIFFASPSCREILGQTAHGGTMDVLNMGALKALAYPVPPLREQHRIVASVRERESVLAHTLEDLKTSLLRIDRLRQSILKWAFEGRLVDQDPTDEPASKLLERIKSERAAESAPSPSKRPRRATSKRKSS